MSNTFLLSQKRTLKTLNSKRYVPLPDFFYYTRAIPFLVFGKRQLPGMVVYFEDSPVPAIMVILVIYCLRNISFTTPPYGLAELRPAAGYSWPINS